MSFVITAALALLLGTGVLEALPEASGTEPLAEFVAVLKEPAKLDEGLTETAMKDAASWCLATQNIASKEEAEEQLRGYVNTELKYVGHSYKLGLTRPLDTYRAGCSAMLVHLQRVHGAKPSYSWLEQSLLWLETTSRKE